MALEDWYQLASSIEIIDEPSGIELLTLEEALAFEKKHGFLLPQDYKEFCQVFGTGRAAKCVNLYCATDTLILQQELLYLTIKNISDFPSSSVQEDFLKVDLIQNSFYFGDDSGSCIFMWDLRTYSNLDSSYDSYLGVWDSPSDSFAEDYKYLGRSFFDLVNEFTFAGRIFELDQGDSKEPSSPDRIFERYINRSIV